MKKILSLSLLGIMISTSMLPGIAHAEEVSIDFSESLNQSMSKTITLPNNAYVKSVSVDNGNVAYSKSGNNLSLMVSNGASHRTQWNPYKYSKYISTSRTQYNTSFPSEISYSDGDGYSGVYSQNGSYQQYGSYTPEHSFTASLTRDGQPGWGTAGLATYLDYENESEGRYTGYYGRLYEYSTSAKPGVGYPSGEKNVTSYSSQGVPGRSTPEAYFGTKMNYSDSSGYTGTLNSSGYEVISKWYQQYGNPQRVITSDEHTLLAPPPKDYGTGDWFKNWSTYAHKVWFQTYSNGVWRNAASYSQDYFKSFASNQDKWTRGWFSNSSGRIPVAPKTWSGQDFSFTQFAEASVKNGQAHARFQSRPDENHHEGNYTYYHSLGRMKYSGKVTRPDTQVYQRTYRGEVRKPAVDTRYYVQNYHGVAYKPGYDNYYRYQVTVDYIIDNELPDFNLTANPTSFTNHDVTITANNVKDFGDSGLRGVLLPNGVWVNAETVPYNVSQNGTYTFRAEDNVGNATTKSITVSNIDKIVPTATLTQSPTGWTKGNVLLTLSNIQDGGVSGLKEVILPDGTKQSTFSDIVFEVKERGKYTFQIVDNAGNVTNKSIDVMNIDREAPDADFTKNPNGFTNKDVTIQVRNVRDVGTSGMKSLMLPHGEFIVPGNHDYVVTDNGNYAFRLEDNAGNSVIKTINVNTIDRIKPSAKFSLSTTEATRDDVMVNITDIHDEGVSGLKHVKYPDGSIDTTFEDKSYPLKKNGTYTFEVSDNAGNTIQYTTTVVNIDQDPPTADVIKTPSDFTKDSVEVRVFNIRDIGFAGLKSVTHPDGTVTKDEEIVYVVNENETRDFILEDNIGNKKVLRIAVTNIDNDAPQADMRMSTEDMTNKDVTLYLSNLRDIGTSGLKTVTLPNGTVKTTFENISYSVSSNNRYRFIIEDNAGNIVEKTFDVKNIDKIPPTADVSQTPLGFTNKDVSLKLTNIQDMGVSKLKAITLPNGEKVNSFEDSLFPVSENGTYTFAIEDHAGNQTNKSITVGNIDKDSPTASLSQTPTALTNSNVTLILSQVNDSGVSGLESIRLPNGVSIAPTATTSFVVTANGSYQFVIRDKAGNETIKTITVMNIDKYPPNATLRPSTTDFTNQDVTLFLENIKDVGVGGMKSIVLPNGEMEFTFEDKAFVVTENGTYTFALEDNARNNTMKSITVNNIDKENPLADIDYSPKAINKGPVTISMKNIQDIGVSGVHEVRLPNGTRVPAEETVDFNVFENGEYTMTLFDKAGNSIVKTVKIANIDNQMPDADIVWSKGWTNNSVVISLTNFRDEGIAGYDSVRLPNGVAVSGASTSYIVTENGDYSFVVRDKVGNERTKVAHIRNIDKGLPLITFTEKEKTSTKVKVNVFIKDSNKKR